MAHSTAALIAQILNALTKEEFIFISVNRPLKYLWIFYKSSYKILQLSTQSTWRYQVNFFKKDTTLNLHTIVDTIFGDDDAARNRAVYKLTQTKLTRKQRVELGNSLYEYELKIDNDSPQLKHLLFLKGFMTAVGIVYRRDYFRGIDYLDEAIDQGSVNALTIRASMYLLGFGTKIDTPRALKLYRQAEQSNDVLACQCLAHFAEKGGNLLLSMKLRKTVLRLLDERQTTVVRIEELDDDDDDDLIADGVPPNNDDDYEDFLQFCDEREYSNKDASEIEDSGDDFIFGAPSI